MLGRLTPPAFLHHPLIRHPAGAKLSKANRDSGIRKLRAAGMPPADVLGLAAYRVGLVKQPGELRVSELALLFPG
jgi:glutamyl/glutaminyl-tRNA synthetase